MLHHFWIFDHCSINYFILYHSYVKLLADSYIVTCLVQFEWNLFSVLVCTAENLVNSFLFYPLFLSSHPLILFSYGCSILWVTSQDSLGVSILSIVAGFFKLQKLIYSSVYMYVYLSDFSFNSKGTETGTARITCSSIPFNTSCVHRLIRVVWANYFCS
jgi:hypothetical protein